MTFAIIWWLALASLAPLFLRLWRQREQRHRFWWLLWIAVLIAAFCMAWAWLLDCLTENSWPIAIAARLSVGATSCWCLDPGRTPQIFIVFPEPSCLAHPYPGWLSAIGGVDAQPTGADQYG